MHPGGGPDVGGLHGVGQHGGVQGAQPAHAAPAQHLRDAVKTVKENSHLGITRQAFNLTAGQSAFVLSGLVLSSLVLLCVGVSGLSSLVLANLVLFCLGVSGLSSLVCVWSCLVREDRQGELAPRHHQAGLRPHRQSVSFVLSGLVLSCLSCLVFSVKTVKENLHLSITRQVFSCSV